MKGRRAFNQLAKFMCISSEKGFVIFNRRRGYSERCALKGIKDSSGASDLTREIMLLQTQTLLLSVACRQPFTYFPFWMMELWDSMSLLVTNTPTQHNYIHIPLMSVKWPINPVHHDIYIQSHAHSCMMRLLYCALCTQGVTGVHAHAETHTLLVRRTNRLG